MDGNPAVGKQKILQQRQVFVCRQRVHVLRSKSLIRCYSALRLFISYPMNFFCLWACPAHKRTLRDEERGKELQRREAYSHGSLSIELSKSISLFLSYILISEPVTHRVRPRWYGRRLRTLIYFHVGFWSSGSSSTGAVRAARTTAMLFAIRRT
jgi:hypothetical protein